MGFDYRTYTGLGKESLEGQKQYLVCTRTQEKGVMTPQETDPDMPVSVQVSPAESWVGGGLLQGRDTECGSVRVGPLEGGHHYLHYLHHTLVSGQATGREQGPIHQWKVGLKIYWVWPHPAEQDPVSPTVSLFHQEASISLLPFSIRVLTERKPQSQKTNQTDHMDHSLV